MHAQESRWPEPRLRIEHVLSGTGPTKLALGLIGSIVYKQWMVAQSAVALLLL
jgi:hypothetical protein